MCKKYHHPTNKKPHEREVFTLNILKIYCLVKTNTSQ